nr:MAG TPA: hypothetical protein [Bacteriophage sp.]
MNLRRVLTVRNRTICSTYYIFPLFRSCWC